MLNDAAWRQLQADAKAICIGAIRAADARELFLQRVRLSRDGLHVEPPPPSKASDVQWPTGRLIVLAAGKASGPMAEAVTEVLGDRMSGGLLITTSDIDRSKLPPCMTICQAGHPLPDDRSVRAADQARLLCRQTQPDDLVVVLLTGGASSLMASPADPLSLGDKVDAVRQLLMAGADIDSLNVVRKHLSAIKGGWLAASTHARVVTLAVSDVLDDDLTTIGSGPTVGDPTTYANALEIAVRFGLDRTAQAAVEHLKRGASGQLPDTPKPGSSALARAEATVIGTRADAVNGAAAVATHMGYEVQVLPEAISGEARLAAREYVEGLRRSWSARHDPKKRLCILSSGETTVTVSGKGQGGRNQEFTLAASLQLPALAIPVVLASFDTDGLDGPTDAAGAIVDSRTSQRAEALGLDIEAALENNDSHRVLRVLGQHLVTGPTRTNVMDVQVALMTETER